MSLSPTASKWGYPWTKDFGPQFLHLYMNRSGVKTLHAFTCHVYMLMGCKHYLCKASDWRYTSGASMNSRDPVIKGEISWRPIEKVSMINNKCVELLRRLYRHWAGSGGVSACSLPVKWALNMSADQIHSTSESCSQEPRSPCALASRERLFIERSRH